MGKKLRFLSLSLLLLLLGGEAFAQTRTVTGTVTSEDGPMPGVSVLVVGSNKGASTDADGKYSLDLSATETSLTFSFIGYKTVTVDVGNRSVVDVALESDAATLDEVVVVGYGSMQEKDLTSAITTIKTDELTKTPTSQPMQALQGKVPGLQIVSNGAPGAGPTVRVRGMGSFPGQGDGDPLYVVDGMFFDNIDFLNPADIETISVMKDASSTAIFGVRAANGVVLITTRSGSYNQKTSIEYNGYYGVQVAQNVLKMANSQQFTNYALATGSPADAAFISNALARYGRSRIDPNIPNVNTDWYDRVIKTAPIQNHSITISGGKDNVRYSVGGSYFEQDGIMEVTRNSYKRINLRAKIDFNATERLSVGANVNLSNAEKFRPDNAAWFNTYFAVPILPVWDDQNTAASPRRLANAQNLGYRGVQNPFYNMYYNDDRSRIGQILGNFYWDYQLIPNKLSFKMAYNYSYGSDDERNVDFAYHNGVTNVQNALARRATTDFNQILDNTLTYTETFDKHNLTVLGGYSYRSEFREGTYARAQNIPTLNPNEESTWFITPGVAVDRDNTGDFGRREYGLSYFGRVAYNYDDRYLLYGTYRRDGTNKFQEKWGNFFTVGAGWIVTEESFFNFDPIDFLKIRGSWGQLGNDAIESAEGQATLQSISTAVNDALVQGIFIDGTFDLVNKWETVEQTNFGFTARALDNRLTVDLDYYIRNTKNAVATLILPAQADVVRRNLGEIRNKGFEMSASWTSKIGNDLSFTIGTNITTLKNEVISLGGQEYIDAGQAEFRQRSIIGQSINAFYGLEVLGVYQNTDQIEDDLTPQFITDNNVQPGDFRYKDQNGDGLITAEDRKVIGNILPSFTYGFNLGVNWKGFELSANFQGVSGNSILNRKRGELIFTNDTNIDADLATNLWDGEGSTNKYPSAAGLRRAWNLRMSEYFVEDGDYFRIQNVRLAYNFASREVFGVTVPQTKIIFTAERPVTVFNYNGFNPEVSDGVDRQTYPIPAVYTIGLNVKF